MSRMTLLASAVMIIIGTLTARGATSEQFRSLSMGSPRAEVEATVGEPDSVVESADLGSNLGIYLVKDDPLIDFYMIGYDEEGTMTIFGHVFNKGRITVDQLVEEVTGEQNGMTVLSREGPGTLLVSEREGRKHYAFINQGTDKTGPSFLYCDENVYTAIYDEAYRKAYEEAKAEAGLTGEGEPAEDVEQREE